MGLVISSLNTLARSHVKLIRFKKELQTPYSHTHVHTHAHARTHTHARTQTQTDTDTHTHTHTHTHRGAAKEEWKKLFFSLPGNS